MVAYQTYADLDAKYQKALQQELVWVEIKAGCEMPFEHQSVLMWDENNMFVSESYTKRWGFRSDEGFDMNPSHWASPKPPLKGDDKAENEEREDLNAAPRL